MEEGKYGKTVKIALGIIVLLLVIKIFVGLLKDDDINPNNPMSLKEFKLSSSQLFDKQIETGDCIWLSGWGEPYSSIYSVCGEFALRFSDEIRDFPNIGERLLGPRSITLCVTKKQYERMLKKYGAEVGKVKACININIDDYGEYYYVIEDLKFNW